MILFFLIKFLIIKLNSSSVNLTLTVIVFLCNNIANTNTVTMADEVMRIDVNCRVGIGVSNPAFNLEIGAGTGTTGSIAQRYFGISNTSGTGPSYAASVTNNVVALKVNGSIWGTGYIVSSDIPTRKIS